MWICAALHFFISVFAVFKPFFLCVRRRDVLLLLRFSQHPSCQRLSVGWEDCEGEIYGRSVWRDEPNRTGFNKNLSKIQLQTQKLINPLSCFGTKNLSTCPFFFFLSVPGISFWPRSITLLVNSFYTCSNNCSS